MENIGVLSHLFIYSLVAFNEAFETRLYNSFVEKSFCISWEKCFVKTYSSVFSETKCLKSKNRDFFSKSVIYARGQAVKHPENFRLLVNIPVTFRLIKLPERGR